MPDEVEQETNGNAKDKRKEQCSYPACGSNPNGAPSVPTQKNKRHQCGYQHDSSYRAIITGLIRLQNQNKPGNTDDSDQEKPKLPVELEKFVPKGF
jgi:hypothetical protein